ncbi:MAG: hypothetical protein ACLPKB_10900 [Xanthobacteraceae bacterium]
MRYYYLRRGWSLPLRGLLSVRKAVLIGAILALLDTVAGAQTTPLPAGNHAIRLVKLPNGDYTVPMSALEGSGTSGNVTLHPEGMKTIFTIIVLGKPNHKHVFSLRSGSDCSSLGAANTNTVALAPARTGQPSQTIVSLPISSLTSKEYIVTAQDATARQQFQEACASI